MPAGAGVLGGGGHDKASLGVTGLCRLDPAAAGRAMKCSWGDAPRTRKHAGRGDPSNRPHGLPRALSTGGAKQETWQRRSVGCGPSSTAETV